MFNWKKLFKKRIDPKDIPVLEDVIDDVINDSKIRNEAVEDYPHLFSKNEESTNEKLTTEDDEFVIDLNDEDENNVVILSSVIGQTEDDIDEIDIAEIDVSDINDPDITNSEIDDSDIDIAEKDAAKTDMSEIDNAEDDSEKSPVDETTETDDNKTDDSDTGQSETSDNNFDLSDPEQLEMIVDKVVEQLKPELELQLHSFVQKALTEKSPEEFLKSLQLDDKPTSNKS